MLRRLLARGLARDHRSAEHRAVAADNQRIKHALANMHDIASELDCSLAQLAIAFLVKWSPGDIPRLSEAALHVQGFVFAASAAVLAAMVDAINRLPERNRFVRGLRSWVGFRQTGITIERSERFSARRWVAENRSRAVFAARRPEGDGVRRGRSI